MVGPFDRELLVKAEQATGFSHLTRELEICAGAPVGATVGEGASLALLWDFLDGVAYPPLALLVESLVDIADDHVLLGLDRRDPLLARLERAFRHRVYCSVLCLVAQQEDAGLLPRTEGKLCFPEVAVL